MADHPNAVVPRAIYAVAILATRHGRLQDRLAAAYCEHLSPLGTYRGLPQPLEATRAELVTAFRGSGGRITETTDAMSNERATEVAELVMRLLTDALEAAEGAG